MRNVTYTYRRAHMHDRSLAEPKFTKIAMNPLSHLKKECLQSCINKKIKETNYAKVRGDGISPILVQVMRKISGVYKDNCSCLLLASYGTQSILGCMYVYMYITVVQLHMHTIITIKHSLRTNIMTSQGITRTKSKSGSKCCNNGILLHSELFSK